MQRIILFLLVGLWCIHGNAQQQVQYTQFLQNKLWFNPAYAGSHGNASLQGIARNQWLGLDGAPKTAAISFHTPSERNRTGYGMTMTYDQIGPTKAYTTGLSYAYKLWQSDERSLSGGLNASYTWWQVDFRDIETTTAIDNAFQINPNALNWTNFGLGIYYQSERGFLGFSAPSLLQREFFQEESIDLQAQFERHWYVMGGHIFELRDDIDLNTGVLVKYVTNAPLDLDVSGILIFSERLWTGINLRLGNHTNSVGTESLDFILQYQISDPLRMGLAYDRTLSALHDQHDGTLELLVDWQIVRNVKNVKSLRYF